MLTKEQVLKSINDLPDSFSIDEVIDRLVFLQKIETGTNQSKNDDTISNSDAKNKMNKWLM